MTRMLGKRLEKLEAIGKPVVRVPCVLHVRRDETTAEARARFAAKYPDAPRGHRLLVVPGRDRSAADNAQFEVGFRAQQTTLIANAKSERRKGTDKC
jgi:hypothetical protein